jgi:hypothetical protein
MVDPGVPPGGRQHDARPADGNFPAPSNRAHVSWAPAPASPSGAGPEHGFALPRPALGARLGLATAIAALGMVLMVVGTFLPWVVSGQVRRSSYAAAGVIDRLGIASEEMLDVLVGVWPLFGAICVLPVVAALLRRWRTAGVLAVLLALVGAAVSVSALAFAARSGPSGTVSLDPLGPTVTVAGAALLLVGGLLLAFRRSSRMSPG